MRQGRRSAAAAWFAAIALATSGTAFAGVQSNAPVPVLSDHGLVLLGVALAAVGVAVFRRRRT
jgi:hypothetical protein